MEASKLFSLFQIPYHSWISIATIFGYKLNTPTPLLETMYMYDIILQYKELEKIIKQENGEGDGENPYENKMNEYQDNMKTQMDNYKSQFSSSMPNTSSLPSTNSLPNVGNLSSISSGFKMPKF